MKLPRLTKARIEELSQHLSEGELTFGTRAEWQAMTLHYRNLVDKVREEKITRENQRVLDAVKSMEKHL